MKKEVLMKEARREITEKRRSEQVRIVKTVLYIVYALVLFWIGMTAGHNHAEKVLLIAFGSMACYIFHSFMQSIVKLFFEPKISDKEVYDLYKKKILKK